MASAIRISILANASRAVRGLNDTTAASRRTELRLTELSRSLSRLDGRTAKVSLSLKGFAQGTASIIAANLALDHMGHGLPDLSFGISGVANKMALMTAAALAATAAALPLVGATVALGGALGAAGAGVALFGAVALPTIKSVTTAVGEYNTAAHAFDRAKAVGDTKKMTKAEQDMASALGALTPIQRKAAEQVLAMHGAWDRLSKSQAPLVLGILTAGSATLARIIPSLTPAIEAMAGAVKSISGDTFTGLARSVKPFVQLVVTQGVPALRSLATVIGNIAPTVGHLVTAFAPLGGKILQSLIPVTAALKKFDFSGLAKTATNLFPLIVSLLKNMSGGILNFIRAAAPLSGPILEMFSDIAGAIKDAFGGSDLAEVFVKNLGALIPAVAPIATVLVQAFSEFAAIISTGLLPIIPQLLPLVKQIADVFVNVLTGVSPLLPALLSLIGVLVSLLPVVYPIITAIREALIPVLGVLGGALTTLAPSLPILIGAMVNLAVAATPLIPVIAQVAAAFAGGLSIALVALAPLIAGFSTWASNNVGLVKVIAFAVLGFAAAVKISMAAVAAYNTVAEIWMLLTTGNMRAFIALRAELVLQKISLAATTVATAVQTAASSVATAATSAWAAVQAAFNFVMALNPIFLIVIGIIALVAVVILAYKHSETFRRIVDGAMRNVAAAFKWLWEGAKLVFGWLVDHWKLILIVITGPIGLVVFLVTKYWTQIKNVTVGAFNAVKGFLAGIWNWIVERFRSGVAGIVAIFHGIMAVVQIVINLRNRVVGYLLGIAKDFIAAGKNIMQGLIDGISAGFNWVRDKLKGLGGLIPDWLQSALGISSPSKVMAKIGGQIIDGLARGIDKSVPVLRKTIGGVSDLVQSGISTSATLNVGNAQITGGGTGGGTAITLNVNVAPTADKAAVGKAVVDAIKDWQRQTGRVVLASTG